MREYLSLRGDFPTGEVKTGPPPRHHPIRSFVLRQDRLTPGQGLTIAEADLQVDRVRIAEQRREVEGLAQIPGDPEAGPQCVVGTCLAELASRYPQRNYLGIEVHRPGVGHLLLEIEKRGLTNLRICRHDAVEFLEQGLARASLDGVYLFFPDPWPKQRHHKRRILKSRFVASLGRVIRPGGLFHVATDWEPYARQMLELLDAGDLFVNVAGPGAFHPRPQTRPLTRFEQRGIHLGHQVRDLIFRRRQ